MSCPFVALNPLVDLVKMTWMLTIDGAPVHVYLTVGQLSFAVDLKVEHVYYLIAKLPNYYAYAYLMWS